MKFMYYTAFLHWLNYANLNFNKSKMQTRRKRRRNRSNKRKAKEITREKSYKEARVRQKKQIKKQRIE